LTTLYTDSKQHVPEYTQLQKRGQLRKSAGECAVLSGVVAAQRRNRQALLKQTQSSVLY
jgi:hypothetical protein